MFAHAMRFRYTLTAPRRIGATNRLCVNGMSTLPSLEELQAIVPENEYINISEIKLLYAQRFRKRQPFGANKLLTLLTQLPNTFSVKPPSSGNGPADWLVKRVPQDAEITSSDNVSITTPAIFNATSTLVGTPVLAAPVQQQSEVAAGTPQKGSRRSFDIQLNDRSEQLVSLADLTASLHHVQTTVPREELASFVFTNSAKKFRDRKVLYR